MDNAQNVVIGVGVFVILVWGASILYRGRRSSGSGGGSGRRYGSGDGDGSTGRKR